MANTPAEETILRLEARKSFALAVWIQDVTGRALDITGSTLRIVAKKEPLPATGSDDPTNLFTNSFATLVDPAIGYSVFYLQASDLNHDDGEYPLSIVMTSEGY